MKTMLRQSNASRLRRRRSLAEEVGLHPDLCTRIQQAAPFPTGPGRAREELEEQTRASLRLLRARKERTHVNVWDGTREPRMRRGMR